MREKTILVILCLMILNSLPTRGICESKGTTIKVIYAPLYLTIASKALIPEAEKIDLYVENFSDMRGNVEKNVIGRAKTGTFDKGTPILIDGGVIGLTTKTLQDVFAQQGFNIVETENSADLIFKGRIKKFWVQEYLSSRPGSEQSEAEVTFDVALIDRVRAKTIWYDLKISHVKSGGSLDTTAHNEIIINAAFSKVISSIIHDEDMKIAIKDFIQKRK